MKKHNFSAGPSILPREVIEVSAKAVLNWDETNLSLLEVSHRGDKMIKVMEEACALVKELLEVPNNYDVVFLHGGASLQFCMVPYNYLSEQGKGAYVNTGTWSSKAIKEAKLFGDVTVVADSADSNYNCFPSEIEIDEKYDYLHITTNNTIYGTQLYKDLDVSVPLIADMSSDIFSRKIAVSKYTLIYAGAQKNLGPAGVSIAIVKKGSLGKVNRAIPSMLNYQVHIDKGSMFNTPPVFAIFASLQTLRWLKKNGGIEVMEQKNIKKARLLYQEIDRNTLFYGVVDKESRSKMNVCFVMHNPGLEEAFISYAESRGISGIKGHRSVGGFRASIYNAMPIESVEVLVDVMQSFEKENK